MIHGAINGIKSFDSDANFRSLHTPEHDGVDECGIFRQPEQIDAAFSWADIVLDTGGLCENSGEKWEFLKARKRYNKPYIWMSQSFQYAHKEWLEGTHIISRGSRSANYVKSIGFSCEEAPDLSFLVVPKLWVGKKYRRAFVTHQGKQFEAMRALADPDLDIQVITKPPNNVVWEPELGIPTFQGTVEEYFGLLASVTEVHTSRYQCACAAMLGGTNPVFYTKGIKKYDTKYLDLLDMFYNMNLTVLKKTAMRSCIAVKELLE